MEFIEIKNQIKRIKDNRLLRNEEEIINFDKALECLVDMKEYSIIQDLCDCFDDDTSDDEVMFGLIHYIESFDGELGLIALTNAIPSMLNKANKWAKIFLYRILNDEPSRRIYRSILDRVEKQNKMIIINLLHDISAEDPQRFEKYVGQIIS